MTVSGRRSPRSTFPTRPWVPNFPIRFSSSPPSASGQAADRGDLRPAPPAAASQEASATVGARRSPRSTFPTRPCVPNFRIRFSSSPPSPSGQAADRTDLRPAPPATASQEASVTVGDRKSARSPLGTRPSDSNFRIRIASSPPSPSGQAADRGDLRPPTPAAASQEASVFVGGRRSPRSLFGTCPWESNFQVRIASSPPSPSAHAADPGDLRTGTPATASKETAATVGRRTSPRSPFGNHLMDSNFRIRKSTLIAHHLRPTGRSNGSSPINDRSNLQRDCRN